MKTTISCQCPKDLKDKFQRYYPYTMTRFLIKAITLACRSRDFFEQVYFSEV